MPCICFMLFGGDREELKPCDTHHPVHHRGSFRRGTSLWFHVLFEGLEKKKYVYFLLSTQFIISHII